jgi:hypothetical protein
VSFADFIVAAAVTTVKQCSRGRVIIPHTVGRRDATLADDTILPTPATIVEKKHIEVLQTWYAGSVWQRYCVVIDVPPRAVCGSRSGACMLPSTPAAVIPLQGLL